MAAYVIGELDVHDPTRLAEYLEKVPATVERYGGMFLAAGAVAAVLEGEFRPTQAAVIAFTTVDDARRWYDSEDYRAIRELRWSSGPSSVALLDA